jgi:hypothetical protein
LVKEIWGVDAGSFIADQPGLLEMIEFGEE